MTTEMNPELLKEWKHDIKRNVKTYKDHVKYLKKIVKDTQADLDNKINRLKIYEVELKRLDKEGV